MPAHRPDHPLRWIRHTGRSSVWHDAASGYKLVSAAIEELSAAIKSPLARSWTAIAKASSYRVRCIRCNSHRDRAAPMQTSPTPLNPLWPTRLHDRWRNERACAGCVADLERTLIKLCNLIQPRFIRRSPTMESASPRAPRMRILHNAEESFCSKMGHTRSQFMLVLWLMISKLREGQSSVAGVLSS